MKHVFQSAAGIVVAIVAIIAVAAAVVYGTGLFRRTTADFRGDVNVTEQVQGNANFRIAAYERFFDLCAAVQADEARIAALNTELDGEPPEDRRTQINASLTAIRASRANKIAQYNAAAAQDYTAAQFRDSDLPFRLNPNAETTECAP